MYLIFLNLWATGLRISEVCTLRVLRNALDGADVDTGIGTADDAGNCLTEGEDYRYSENGGKSCEKTVF